MKTDLDRLHKVIEVGPFCPRGAGRTFASCHNLAGILETCEEGAYIFWPLPHMHWLRHIRSMVTRVLGEHRLEFEWVQRAKLKCGSKTVVFAVITQETVFNFSGFSFYIVNTLQETWEYCNHKQRETLSHIEFEQAYRGNFNEL